MRDRREGYVQGMERKSEEQWKNEGKWVGTEKRRSKE